MTLQDYVNEGLCDFVFSCVSMKGSYSFHNEHGGSGSMILVCPCDPAKPHDI